MARRVLVVEPGSSLADLLENLLLSIDCEFTLTTDGRDMRHAMAAEPYHCVIVNLNQNTGEALGLAYAEQAAQAGAEIIIIPDHRADLARIDRLGWQRSSQAFVVGEVTQLVEAALAKHTGDQDTAVSG